MSIRKAYAVMAAAIILLASAPAAAAETPSEIYSKAKAMVNAGNYAKASSLAEKYKKIKPADHSGYQLSGMILYKSGKYNKALEQFAKSKKIFSGDYVSETYSGFSLLKTGEIKQAKASFERAYAINKEYPQSLIGLGACCLKEKDPAKAKMHMKKAMKTAGDNDPEVYKDIAGIYLSENMPNDAIYVYNQYLKLEDENPDIYYRLGKIYESLDNRRCEKMYEKASELKKKNPVYKEALAGYLMSHGRSNDAISIYEEAVACGSKAWQPYYYTALPLFQKGDYKKTADRLKKAIKYRDAKFSKDIATAKMALSAALLRSKEYKECSKISMEFLKDDPKNESLWFNAACAYAMEGKKSEALKSLSKAVSLEKSNKDIAKNSEMFKSIKNDPEFIRITK